MSPHDRDRLVGKTIAKVEYMAPDMAENTNGMNETIVVTCTDGTVLKVWSYGFSLDATVI